MALRAPTIFTAALLALAGLAALFGLAPVAAEDPPPSIVPDVSKMTLPEAAQVLAESGLNIETYFEHHYSQGYALGLVIQQKPRPGTLVKRGSGVQLMVMAAVDGNPGGKAPDPSWPRAKPWAAPTPPAPPAPAPPVLPTTVPRPRPPGARGGSEVEPEVPPPVAPPSGVLPPAPAPSDLEPTPEEAPPVLPSPDVPPPLPETPAAPVGGPLPATVTPSGSPDAPVVAARATPGEVPDLCGLTLNDAEQRAREAELELYVERVPGHPVGRVVTQVPAATEKRPKGSVVRVTVTAGGDYDGATVPIPAVDVPRVMVPDLLDRTPPQAERIVTDLGLVYRREEAKSGLPGRVVDQKPAAGSEIPKGSVVTVWITPAPTPAPGGSGSAPVGPAAAPAPVHPTPAPPPAATPAGGPPGVPEVIAPCEGTVVPKQRALLLGFAWLPIDGADGYVLELEERGPEGWLASVRKVARATATTVELERLAATPGELRWRVRAVVAGREGQPSAWVTLR